MLNSSCYDFLNDLGSKSPTPGGGSAAGLVAALGASLGVMAAELSYGKKAVAEHWDEIQNLSAELKNYSIMAAELVNKDAEGFLPLSRAYGIKAVTDEEKEEKARIMEEGLITAAEAPQELLELCFFASISIERLVSCSTKLALSDVGCAAALCAAGARSAFLNVIANTRLMEDNYVASEMAINAEIKLKTCLAACDRTFEKVKEALLWLEY